MSDIQPSLFPEMSPATPRFEITLRTYIYFNKDGKCVHCQAGGGAIGEEYEHDDLNWQPPPDWPYEVRDLRKEVTI